MIPRAANWPIASAPSVEAETSPNDGRVAKTATTSRGLFTCKLRVGFQPTRWPSISQPRKTCPGAGVAVKVTGPGGYGPVPGLTEPDPRTLTLSSSDAWRWKVTVLSTLVEAALGLPSASLAAPAFTVAMSVPALVIPLTATV